MGSLSDIIDFNKVDMAKKVAILKWQTNGMETPRNSLELLPERVDRDFVPYLNHMKSNWSDNLSVTQFPIKKMIGEKTSKSSMTKHNEPSVVARLMGVDVLPSTLKPVAQKVEKTHKSLHFNLSEESLYKNTSSGRFSYLTKPKHKRFTSFDSIEDHVLDRRFIDRPGNKPKPREHPQEEELQKFKKEFEAWQMARLKEIPEINELGITPSQWLAQENLNKEKMVYYSNSTRPVQNPKPLDSVKRDQNSNTKLSFSEGGFRLSPSQIVVLKPGMDRTNTYEESCLNSPSTSFGRGNMEDFLEQVKNKLNCELHGKGLIKTTTARGGGIETPYSEKPSDTKLIARHIAKHVKKRVTKNFRMNPFSSESTKLYKRRLKEANSHDYLIKDDIKLLVQKEPKLSELRNKKWKTHKSREISNQMNKVNCVDIIENGLDMQSRSFRHESNREGEIHKESSPMKLTRSLSAPLSRNAFANLLLEDRDRLTGAHIQRKHEEIEKKNLYENKQKKDKFNLKEKVTSLKNSFMLKRKLFGKRIQLPVELKIEHDPMNDFCNSMIMSPFEKPEDSTEVPPSPASLCISVLEESWQPSEYFSPPPVSDAVSPWDSTTPNVFKEISSNLEELRRQLKQLETYGSDEATVDEQNIKAGLADIEDEDEEFIRDLLLVSGLYENSWEKSLSKWDSFGKLINTRVFEEAEDSWKQKIVSSKNQVLEVTVNDHCEKSNHKLLFDLVNESLPVIFGLRNSKSPLALDLYGKKLLDRLWQTMRVYLHSPGDRSRFCLDSAVARDLHGAPWLRLDDDFKVVGKDIECLIVEDLIDEIVKEMQCVRCLS